MIDYEKAARRFARLLPVYWLLVAWFFVFPQATKGVELK